MEELCLIMIERDTLTHLNPLSRSERHTKRSAVSRQRKVGLQEWRETRAGEQKATTTGFRDDFCKSTVVSLDVPQYLDEH